MKTIPVSDSTSRILRRVASLVTDADALLITAGAGMSAASGLPVFRDPAGLKIPFERMAQPEWFTEKPRMAWAFYGHRLQQYRETTPHAGHEMLRQWAAAMRHGSFTVTSNVDGQFLKAGFPRQCVAEQHGSIHRLQCSTPCSGQTWETPLVDLQIDLAALEAKGELPLCPRCGAIARPNILMFNDPAWVCDMTRRQNRAFDSWLTEARGCRVLVIEIGAGTAIPTIRRISERAAERPRATLVRINPQAIDEDGRFVVLPLGALQALSSINANLPMKFMARCAAGSASSARGQASACAPKGAAPRWRDENLDPLPSREMEALDFPGLLRGPPDNVRLAERLGLARLRSFNFADLRNGTLQSIDPFSLLESEEEACLEQWFAAQRASVPLPVIRHCAAPGFTMSGGVLDSGDFHAGMGPGAAILYIHGPSGEPVSTVGMARRPADGARLWRHLIEQARTPIQPMDYPCEPWIARRLEPGHARNAAMLHSLSALECSIAVSWLKHQALHDWRPHG